MRYLKLVFVKYSLRIEVVTLFAVHLTPDLSYDLEGAEKKKRAKITNGMVKKQTIFHSRSRFSLITSYQSTNITTWSYI